LTIQDKLPDVDDKQQKTVTCDIEGHYSDSIAKCLAPEREILKTEILQRLHEWKIRTAEKNKCEEEQYISVEHEEDLTDENAHEDDSKHTLHDIQESKCGSIISEKDVTDKDLCQTSSLTPVNVGDDLEIEKSRKISEIHETDEIDKCVEYFDKMDESRNCNCNVDYSSEDLETAPYDNETVTSLDREPIQLTEDTCHVTNISKNDQLNRNNNFKYQRYLERNTHGDRTKPNLHDIRAKQLRYKRGKEKTFHIDFNPVGAFERGTQYRTEREVVIEKCKRGLIISEKRTEVKTRDVPNKHLCQASSLMPVNVGDDLEIDKSRNISDTCIHKTYKMDDCVENLNKSAESRKCNSNRENLEIAIYDPNVTGKRLDGEPIELTKDTRHLMNMPTQIIQGKKNDCDLLEEKCAPKNNKKRQKENKKKRHRTKFVQSNMQFGLNSNNSADDPNMWSTDEEDDDYVFISTPDGRPRGELFSILYWSNEQSQ
jgi:hypothetical protein